MKKKNKTSKSKEFNFKGSKRGRRLDPKTTKVGISVRLDAEVVLWLKEESEKTAIPYQTLLNSILTQEMKGHKERLRKEIRAVLKEEQAS